MADYFLAQSSPSMWARLHVLDSHHNTVFKAPGVQIKNR
jgi:hypothetical protein